MPKVSVIISTYNRPELLKRAIESVEKQTFTDWELIVVHDIDGYTAIEQNNGKIKQVSLGKHFGNDTKPKKRQFRSINKEFFGGFWNGYYLRLYRWIHVKDNRIYVPKSPEKFFLIK